MKVLKSWSVILAMAFVSQASARSLTEAANGIWSIADRMCSDSSRLYSPTDRFQLGRDSLVVQIQGNHGSVKTVIEGSTRIEGFYIDQESQVILGELRRTYEGRFESSFPGRVVYKFGSKNESAFLNFNEMVLVSGGFGKNGSCLENESLFTTLKRIK
ncbi:MAG: hypothetical protein K2X47_10085 [Bdellovibrionales bacterium]|nr:hypothetical protein [Bdellovibrionales bacterium]